MFAVLVERSSEPDTLGLHDVSESQFMLLVEPALPKMLHLAERIGGHANRDDIVQEALFKAWSKRGQFDPGRGSLAVWLLAITANQAKKTWRRRALGRYRSTEEFAPSIDERLDVERAIHQLPPRQRLAVDCFYFVGLTVAETAAVMACSEGTVKATLSHARDALRVSIEDPK